MNVLAPYIHMLHDLNWFKFAGTAHDGNENIHMYDTPAQKYFKIMFYFGSESEFINNGNNTGSGLLAPTWEEFKSQSTSNNYYDYNSAWAYLKLNDENERAEKLEHFITLLSDISTKSPWYFSSISGVQEALERKVAEDGKLEMSDKKLTITCLPDAFDNRIGTLLELYRDVTWSWVYKREVIPANLRKFDMAICIFEAPDHRYFANYGTYSYRPSYKIIEFHDCEINYNSIKSGWSELNNIDGTSPKYSIEISFADCYDVSYNNIMMRTIGDIILTDLINNAKLDNAYESQAQQDDGGYDFVKELDKVSFTNILNNSAIKQAVLGNLKDYPLSENFDSRFDESEEYYTDNAEETYKNIYDIEQ